jgi:hypothetical protein
MTRHIIDHDAERTGSRTLNFLRIARKEAEHGLHPATRILHSRPVKRDGAATVVRFVRIERGIET